MPRLILAGCMLGAILLAPRVTHAQAQDYHRCISIDTTSNSLTAFLINSCDIKLNVSWVDAGECRTRCMLPVGPRSRQSAGGFKPPALWAACPWPGSARSSDGLKTFSCPSANKPNPPQANTPPANSPDNSGKQTNNPPRTPAATVPAKPRGTGKFVAATPLVRVAPDYPARAQSRGIEGWVHVRFVIGADGRTGIARVLASSPEAMFDIAALYAISRWRYNPATQGGQPVASSMEAIVKFQLDGGDMQAPDVAASRPLESGPATASGGGNGGRSTKGIGFLHGTDRFVPSNPRAGGFVAVMGTARNCLPTGYCTNYHKFIAASGRDVSQARDNARRKYSSSQSLQWPQSQEIFSCDYGGWYAAIRGANSAQVMDNDSYRHGFACGHPSRESALKAAMNAYFRAGGVVYNDVAYYVGLASGANYVWYDAPGYYGMVVASSQEQFENCTVEQRCKSQYVGWGFFGR